jgi:hypothetical protein
LPLHAFIDAPPAIVWNLLSVISQALPVTSSATRSPAPRLRANSSICSGVASIRPAERTAPSSEIATSQKSR